MRLFFHPDQDGGGVIPSAGPLQVVNNDAPVAAAPETPQAMTAEDIALAEAYLAAEKARLGVGAPQATEEPKPVLDLSSFEIPTIAVPEGADDTDKAWAAAENARWQAVGAVIKQMAEAINNGFGNPGLNAVIANTARETENNQFAKELAQSGQTVTAADVEAARQRYPAVHPTTAVMLALSDAAKAKQVVAPSTPQMAAPLSVDGQEQIPTKISGADAIAVAERQRQNAAAGN